MRGEIAGGMRDEEKIAGGMPRGPQVSIINYKLFIILIKLRNQFETGLQTEHVSREGLDTCICMRHAYVYVLWISARRSFHIPVIYW